LYAHPSLSPKCEITSGYSIDVHSTAIEAEYEVEIDPHDDDRSSRATRLSVHAHSSCPELVQITQILSLNQNRLDCDYVNKLIMMNTNVMHDRSIDRRSPADLASTFASTDDSSLVCRHCTPAHRMLKSVSQVEPLSLIEKVREVREAVQKTLNCQFKRDAIASHTTSGLDPLSSITTPLTAHPIDGSDGGSSSRQRLLDNDRRPVGSARPDRKPNKGRAASIGRISSSHQRRRAKSLGLLQLSTQPIDLDGNRLEPLSIDTIDPNRTSLSLIQAPLLDRSGRVSSFGARLLVDQLHRTCPTNAARGVFSSSPSIKCDIVEYL
jgi:hypothetical protein